MPSRRRSCSLHASPRAAGPARDRGVLDLLHQLHDIRRENRAVRDGRGAAVLVVIAALHQADQLILELAAVLAGHHDLRYDNNINNNSRVL